MRFIGQHYDEDKIHEVASSLLKSYAFEDIKDEDRCRYRYIIIAFQPNDHYVSQGLTYITYDEIALFLAEVRGESWIRENLGVVSRHDQWPTLNKGIF